MKTLCGIAVVVLGLLVTIVPCPGDPYVVPGGNDGNTLLGPNPTSLLPGAIRGVSHLLHT